MSTANNTAANTVWVNASAGVAGDMLLGALIDAGADITEVVNILFGLGLDDWALTAEPAMRCGIAATHVVVVEHHHDDHRHTHRLHSDIVALLNAADIPARVRERALATFAVLAFSEASVHNVLIEDVEFHEVGSIDAIIDIVGTCAALEILGIDRITSSPIATSHGTIRSAHGMLPNPGPAVVHMLATHAVPTRGVNVDYEVSTPTGVALLIALAESFGASPSMPVTAIGHGAGTRNPTDRANVVQVLLGSTDTAHDGDTETLVVLETNTDDVTPEVLAYTVAQLMENGANDAWVTPIIMKKNRHGHCLQVLCTPPLAQTLCSIISLETGSLGIRHSTVERFASGREVVSVDVLGFSIDVKMSSARLKAE
ncbi:MAG: nickel pincer cofactor biosynthesis protein LarC, partial [Actinobacteria bacterium]|nr:nickel pincer cofactor biosynthesis protein LarC [Actinomycetota bacterium]